MTSLGSTIQKWTGISRSRETLPERLDPDDYLRDAVKMWACFLIGGVLSVLGVAMAVFFLSQIATGEEPAYTELRHPRQVGIAVLVLVIGVTLVKRGARKRAGLKAPERESGCVGFGKGPSDEELVKSVLDRWATAFVARDLDSASELFSEHFRHANYGDKAATLRVMQLDLIQGVLDDAKASYDPETILIEGSSATVTFRTSTGEDRRTYKLEKEVGSWRIVYIG